MTGQDWLEKDFYAVLGVSKTADAAEIKKAYRKLARTLHPDHNPGDARSESRFKEVGEAYAVLSDPEQRRQYDQLRAMAGGARFSAGSGGAGAGGAGFEDLFGGMFGGAGAGAGPRMRYQSTGGGGPRGGAGPAGFEDILGGLFGQGGGGFRQPQPGIDLSATATLAFRQAVEGSTVTLSVDGQNLTVRIPAGVHDGQKIRMRGKGRAAEPGGQPGDLIVTVTVQPHPVFSLEGNDLRVTVPVTFPEAALGATVDVPTLDGSTVRMRVPAGTPSGRVLRARGKGVTTTKGTGDLLVTVQVAVPQRLDGAAREAVEAFATATAGQDPRAEMAARARE
ncbi:DnaJ C-terminal domain-containing protein [Cellulomonas sp. ATA003]|uniref:DnaJ C-terminal domain-containing protein n=1 Tax=Cellulomonas sp. ATA003 TaxID=3073064 RepID=UPI002872D4A6|nr:DnaJ C-terminal domain-containing protein [Cellulomonas sp. ATA003]WNB85795.1 DnaJ C-terminal domain-containing protein [Cellulomonas sp. ATA003]